MRRFIPLLFLAASAFGADEIVLSASLKIASGSVIQSQASGELKYDMTAATPVYAGAVTLLSNATTQTLDAAAVGDPGYLWAKNTSTNGIIYAGPTNAAGTLLPVIELRPGELHMIPRGSADMLFTSSVTNLTALQWFLITR
jgi:hypothetical protein